MVSFNGAWLQQVASMQHNVSHEDLCAQFTQQGIETEVECTFDFTGICIGLITDVQKHPKADKLNVCQVKVFSDGTYDVKQIVCGCSTVKQGLKVAVAMVGAVLPGDFEITPRKIRHIESYGMLCSLTELGFKHVQSQGIWHLHPDAPLDAPISTWLRRQAVVYHMDITPNRGDLMSVRGVSRELCRAVAALDGSGHNDASLPQESCQLQNICSTATKGQAPLLQTDACTDFYAIKLTGILQDKPLPDWLTLRLIDAKCAVHGGVVDIVNYAMLETGQPMHAYDADTIGERFSVAMGNGQRLLLINGHEVELDEQTTCIYSDEEVVGIAGFMGSKDTSCQPKTQCIWLECAYFMPERVAYHCRRYPGHSAAGTRYERGIDKAYMKHSLALAASMIQTYLHGKVETCCFTESSLQPSPPVSMPKSMLQEMLGYSVDSDDAQRIWQDSGIDVVEKNENTWHLFSPTWRYDLSLKQQYVSEILRFCPVSVKKIPLSRTLHTNRALQDSQQARLRREAMIESVAALGFRQTMAYAFLSHKAHRAFAMGDEPLVLEKALNESSEVLRTQQVAGLLQQVKSNIAAGHKDILLFEASKVHRMQEGQAQERELLTMIMTGHASPEHWQGKQEVIDFFLAKSFADSLLAKGGYLHKVSWQDGVHKSFCHPYQQGVYLLDSRPVCFVGALHPETLKDWDVHVPCFIAEFELDALLAHTKMPSFMPIVPYPSMRRDLSLMVPNEITYGSIKNVILSQNNKAYLKSMFVFDIYKSAEVGSDRYALGLALVLQSKTGTLTESDVQTFTQQTLQVLHDDLGVHLRGGK